MGMVAAVINEGIMVGSSVVNSAEKQVTRAEMAVIADKVSPMAEAGICSLEKDISPKDEV